MNSYKSGLIIPAGHFVAMYDPDAIHGTYLHWLQDSTRVYLAYQGPSPPKGTGVHRYIFILVKGSPLIVPIKRTPVDISAIIGNQSGIKTNTIKIDSSNPLV